MTQKSSLTTSECVSSLDGTRLRIATLLLVQHPQCAGTCVGTQGNGSRCYVDECWDKLFIVTM